MSVRSKSLHHAWDQTCSFGSKGTTGSWGVKCATCTNSTALPACSASTLDRAFVTLFIHLMLLLLVGMPHGVIWDRQLPSFPRCYADDRAWSSRSHADQLSSHLHPCTLTASHTTAQTCQHFIPHISTSLEWGRFLMRNLGQNDWLCALVWKTHSNVGGSRLWLRDFTTAQNTFWSIFFWNQKHWASKPLVDSRSLRGVH